MSNQPRAVKYHRLAFAETDQEKVRLLHQLAEEAEQGILVTADSRRMPAAADTREQLGPILTKCPREIAPPRSHFLNRMKSGCNERSLFCGRMGSR